MSRFGEEQDPLFRRINSSISFDWRLAPFDIGQSKAHARALARLGVLDDGELATITEGLEQVGGELEEGSFEFRDDDEDIHMAIERRLTELIGPLGGKLHTARSRNDQVATDLSLLVRAHAARAIALLESLMETLLTLSDAHKDWPAPAYTHLQRAQPVYLGHHLLAYFWMFERDSRRFFRAAEATTDMPAGSGALAGLNWDVDRDALAADLGFERPYPNSLDAVSNRDFALDYLSAASICAMHLSRLGAEIVLWSTQEFGFAELPDSFSSGSSIMPQKKNPDAAELLRGKAPRIAASLASLLGTMHALPLAYSKDLQEDKEPLFDAIDNLELCLAAATGMLAGIKFNRERLAAAAEDEMLAATDLADALVQEGVPFREAHGLVG
jgi:argininosuccinate lyase